MKRAFPASVVLCLLAFLFPLVLKGQTPTAISGMAISQYGQPSSFSTVRVCLVTSTGNPCNTGGVQLFYDYGQTIPAPNPFSSDQYGNYNFYATGATSPNIYLVQVTAAEGLTFSYTFNGASTGGGSGVALSPPVYSIQGYLNAVATVSDPLININTATHTISSPNVISQTYNTAIVMADQFAGVDAGAKINAAAAALPSTGGTIDARGFGASVQTVTTQWTALNVATKPITLILNPATEFIFNTVSAAPCAVPVNDGSAIYADHRNRLFPNMVIGPSFVGTSGPGGHHNITFAAVAAGSPETLTITTADAHGYSVGERVQLLGDDSIGAPEWPQQHHPLYPNLHHIHRPQPIHHALHHDCRDRLRDADSLRSGVQQQSIRRAAEHSSRQPQLAGQSQRIAGSCRPGASPSTEGAIHRYPHRPLADHHL